jgi:hypothetical protein
MNLTRLYEAPPLRTGGLSLEFSGHGFVHVAPHPGLARLNRAHQRMLDGTKMLGRVLVLRGIATSDMPTNHAHAQVDPGVTYLHAVFTDVLIGFLDFDLIQMSALARHGSSKSLRVRVK